MGGAAVVTCVSVGVHGGRLVRGQVYTVHAESRSDGMIRVSDARGRVGTFPRALLAEGAVEVATVVGVCIDDHTAQAATEVVVELSDGQRRLLWVATPTQLAAAGDVLPGTDVRVHLDNRAVVVVSRSDEDVIRRVVRHAWEQGVPEGCSLEVAVEG